VASVELALLLPFLCFLLVIVIDYARIFYFSVALENAARNGAYYASNYPNANYIYNDIYGYKNLDEAVNQELTNLRDAREPSNDPTYTCRYGTSVTGPFTDATAPASGTGYVQVTVNWTFRSITRFPGIPSQVNLSRSVVMQVSPSKPSFEP
jgi:Flp pilus assembly protein TadG